MEKPRIGGKEEIGNFSGGSGATRLVGGGGGEPIPITTSKHAPAVSNNIPVTMDLIPVCRNAFSPGQYYLAILGTNTAGIRDRYSSTI